MPNDTDAEDPFDAFADNPFWTVASGRDHKVNFYFGSRRLAKNDKGWKILHMDVEFSHGSEESEFHEDIEIPFWIRRDLVKIAKAAGKPEQMLLLFSRRDEEKDGKNDPFWNTETHFTCPPSLTVSVGSRVRLLDFLKKPFIF